jgi:hypothetical protein
MEPEGSLQCPEEPAAASYPETEQSSQYHNILSI